MLTRFRKPFHLSAMTLFVIAAGLFLQACAPKSQEDCGFVQNVYGQRIAWKNKSSMTLKLHTSVPDSYVPAIEQAANTWNRGVGRELIIISKERTSLPAGRDNQNVIYFSNTWDQDKLSEQAKTSVYWIGDQIQEADIKFNASNSAAGAPIFQFYVTSGQGYGVNLEALSLHEMGHAIGLKHKDSGVMGAYLANNSDRVQLSSTDLDSLRCEY